MFRVKYEDNGGSEDSVMEFETIEEAESEIEEEFNEVKEYFDKHEIKYNYGDFWNNYGNLTTEIWGCCGYDGYKSWIRMW